MLDKEAYSDIEVIKKAAHDLWGDDCVFGEFKELDSPYHEFEWTLHLYGRFRAILSYDRSMQEIQVLTKEGYVTICALTDEDIYGGFDGLKPEGCRWKNLYRNYQFIITI